MPNFDRTGPEGLGSMTGRAAGPCGGNATARIGNRPRAGRRSGRGRGRGRGFGGFQAVDPAFDSIETVAPLTEAEKRRALKAERNRLKAMLREVEEKLQGKAPPQASETDETG